MARKRLSMQKIREALRLKVGGLSYRGIARVCLIGKETVREYLGRAAEAGLTWPLPEGLSEEELERRLFPHERVSYRKEAESDWAYVSRELRKKGVTLGVMDGLTGLEIVFKEEFGNAQVQRCQVHVARNVLAKVPQKLK